MSFGGLSEGNVNNPNGRSGELPVRDCPLCGESVKQLPSHYRHQCPEVDR